jgi:hypothetical protein
MTDPIVNLFEIDEFNVENFDNDNLDQNELFNLDFDIDDVETETIEINRQLDTLVFKTNSNSDSVENDCDSKENYSNSNENDLNRLYFDEFDAKYSYDFQKGSRIDNLVINLGSDEIPRIICENHKINIEVRAAIIKHPVVCSYLKN